MKKMQSIGFLAGVMVVVSAGAVEAPIAQKDDAADSARESSLSLGLERNPGNLNSGSLGADIAVGETPRILADYGVDGLPKGTTSETSAKSVSLGLGLDFSREFTAALRGHYQSLPNSVYAKGGELSGKYRLGDWRFGLGLKTLRYTSDRSLSGKKLRENGIPERSAKLSVTYLLSADWSVRVSGTRYHYGGATPAELSEVLAQRPQTSVGLLSAVEGFPSKSGTVGIGFQASDAWDFDLSFARTSYELAPTSSSATLAIGFQANDQWNIGLSGTNLRQDGLKTGKIVGLQVGFTWN